MLRKMNKSFFLLLFLSQLHLGFAAMETEPLKFKTHDLNIQAYSVSDVKIEYAGTQFTLFEGKVSKAKTAQDETKYPNGKSGSYVAFNSLANVEWCSQDGDRHKYELDFNEIFKEKKVLHDADPAQIYKPLPILGNEPTIIIELNNRTLNVYMYTVLSMIPVNSKATTREQHENRVLAFSKTF
jgi:hypothetical protein